jgi:hypothetical protein
MPELTFDFKWYRDAAGYRLIPAKPITLRRGQSILDIPSNQIQPARILRKGGPLQSYRPLDEFPTLFRHFIQASRTEAGVLGFVQKFGPLTHAALQRRDGIRNGDVVLDIIDSAEEMVKLLRGGIVAMPLKQLNASVVTEADGIRLKVGPACLLDALWLQLAQAKSGGKASFRECLQCHTLFATGVGTDRRADAKFCSDKCRITFNSLERSR